MKRKQLVDDFGHIQGFNVRAHEQQNAEFSYTAVYTYQLPLEQRVSPKPQQISILMFTVIST